MTLFRVNREMTTSLESNFPNLRKIQFYWCLPTKDIDQHFDFELLFVDFNDLALEICEWAFFDPHTLIEFIKKAWLDLSLLLIAKIGRASCRERV